MAASRWSCCTGTRKLLVPAIISILIVVGAGSWEAPESSSLGRSKYVRASHHGSQAMEVPSDRSHPRRGGANFGERPAHSQAWRSIFKEYRDVYGDDTVLFVSTDGTTDYSSIQDAVAQVPDNNTRRITIYISSGVYEEKVVIPVTKSYITFQGEGRDRTIITWNDTAGASSTGGTLMSASVVVESDHFIARDMSFRNSAGPPASNKTNMQAAAFRISGDMAVLFRCNFFGYQDTLYDHKGRHYYLWCFIEGSEDFIFGFARSLFDRCWLHSIAEDQKGAIAAQGKYYPGNDMGPSGFSFLSCLITGTGRPFLGRAWGQYSTIVYSYCLMDANIKPEGWYDWGVPDRDRTAYFGQYRCTGEGANTTGRVYWARELTDAEAQPFLGIQFIDGPW